MDESQRGFYAAALRAKQAELIKNLNQRDGLAAEAEPETGDEIQRALDRALVIETLDRTSALLREVRAAIERVGNGEYGRCLNCEEEISPKRLAVVPWARFCLKCQEESDGERRRQPGGVEFLSAA